jgi:hypothetical protein
MKKTYTITIETENEKMNMHRVNDGFNAFELLGLLEIARSEILQQLKGEIKPDFIKRDVVEDEGICINPKRLLCHCNISTELTELLKYEGFKYYEVCLDEVANFLSINKIENDPKWTAAKYRELVQFLELAGLKLKP